MSEASESDLSADMSPKTGQKPARFCLFGFALFSGEKR